jgi:hypothetical protein
MLFLGRKRTAEKKAAAILLKSNPLDYNTPMNTVVELPEFIRKADKLLRDAERQELIQHLAAVQRLAFCLRAQAASANCAGNGKAPGKAAEFGSSTISTMSCIRSFF